MKIRPIEILDNEQLASVIRFVFEELNAPKIGTAYADPYLNQLFEVYQKKNSIYFVIENNGKIVGGCGIAPLENGNSAICELQKMYFMPEIRGLGLARIGIEKCLEFAKNNGFTYCYIETLPLMEVAQQVYLKLGFSYLDAPMGNTGHGSCDIWMGKLL